MMRLFKSTMLAALAVFAGLHSFAAEPSNESTAEELAARAEKLIDDYDGDGRLLAEAEKDIAASLEKHPLYSHALVEKARLTMIRGDESPQSLQAAELLLQSARNNDFDYGRTYVLQGYVYTKMGNWAEADRAFFKARRLAPGDPWFKVNYADFLEKMGNYEAARQNREEYVAAGSNNKKALYAAHRALWKAYAHKDPAKAEASYAALVQLSPNPPDSAWLRGDRAQSEILSYLDFDAGERYAREALSIMDYPHARGTLSLALYGKWAVAKRDGKDPDVVRKLLKDAQANDPDGKEIPACALRTESLEFVKKSLQTLGIPRDGSQRSC